MNSAARHQELTSPAASAVGAHHTYRARHVCAVVQARPYGFLASDRYCWWKQHLSEWRPAKISILISQPTGRRRHARERFGLVIKAG
jgi:hypothetical protein